MGRRTRNRARLNPPPQPEIPQEEPEKRPLWPFVGALSLVLVILAYIFLVNPGGDEGPTNAQKIRTLTEEYVAAFNRGDRVAMSGLSCATMTVDFSPLRDEPKGVEIKKMYSESPEPGVARADVDLTIDGKTKTVEFWYAPDKDDWQVCRKPS